MVNGKVQMAVVKRDLEYLKVSHDELKGDIKEIKSILITGSGKIAELRGNVNSMKWVFGSLLGLMGLVVAIIGLAG